MSAVVQFPARFALTDEQRRNRARLAQWQSRKAQLALAYNTFPDAVFRLPRYQRLGMNHTLTEIEPGHFRPINICRLRLERV